MRRTDAFTLVEMVAVLALAGLLAAAATLSVEGLGRDARMDDVMDRLAEYDQLARASARQAHRPVTLWFNATRGAVERIFEARDGEPDAGQAVFHLPPGFSIERVMAAGGRDPGADLKLAVSEAGRSASYALRIRGAGRVRWILIAGLTGDLTWPKDEREIDNIFTRLTPAGDDAG